MLISSMAFFDSLFLKRENVEWSGDGSAKDSPRNFLKETLSFTRLNCLSLGD